MKRVAIATMGCKVNAFDSAHLRGRLRGAVEFVPFEHEADVYIVNTCTVTNRSDGEARNLIRRTKRRNPAAVTIVTGCYAQTSPDDLAAIDGVDYVFGNGEKGQVADVVVQGVARNSVPLVTVGDVQTLTEVRHADAAVFDGRTRAFLKVQEGCMYRCAYCIIPRSRGGRSRSVPLAQALEQAARLAGEGFREVVLTGVHIGSWGHEFGREPADLVAAVAGIDGIERVRISSIDSPELRPRLVELIAHHPRVAKHAHVCLQAGSDAVLRRMNRVYTAAEYLDSVERLAAANADVCIGTDVIVGFPGETNGEFEETERFLRDAPIRHFHVFSFSRRQGTPAADMPGAPHGETVKTRSRRLRELGAQKKARWASGFIGRSVPVLFERGAQGGGRGKASNYLDVAVSAPVEPGVLAPVSIETVDAQGRATGRLEP